MKITKDMPIMEIVSKWPQTISVFQEFGLHCIGCAAARFENLEQGCAAHGIDVSKMLKALNKAAGEGK
ncbi:MAG: DUF1858 domain-containing protein [Candidatus Diapherotrites archaeon]|nr:DUF1858 domain-containing protein [Candidatus Diapherotrites archaeon]